jgi:hypothetical protein
MEARTEECNLFGVAEQTSQGSYLKNFFLPTNAPFIKHIKC